jgi:hypothetical protein
MIRKADIPYRPPPRSGFGPRRFTTEAGPNLKNGEYATRELSRPELLERTRSGHLRGGPFDHRPNFKPSMILHGTFDENGYDPTWRTEDGGSSELQVLYVVRDRNIPDLFQCAIEGSDENELEEAFQTIVEQKTRKK